MEPGQVQNVVWCDSAFHVETSRDGLVFSLREALVNGKVIVDTPERRIPLEYVAIADGLLNQSLHGFDPRVRSAINDGRTGLIAHSWHAGCWFMQLNNERILVGTPA
jgi:hypothetical protein